MDTVELLGVVVELILFVVELMCSLVELIVFVVEFHKSRPVFLLKVEL